MSRSRLVATIDPAGAVLTATGALVTGSRGGDVTVVLLGELHYRADLHVEAPGRPDDAERVARVYRRGGRVGLAALEGDFAFLLHDRAAGRVLAVRDPMGGHRLYCERLGGRVVVATDLATLHRLRGRPADLDLDSLADHLAGRSPVHEPAGTSTPFRGVTRVPAGACLQVDLPALTIAVHPLFAPLDAARGRGETISGAVARYREVLGAAVAERAVGAVACHVSGGLDSSAVLRCAADAAERGRCTLVAGISVVYRELALLARETPYVEHALGIVPGLRSVRLDGDDLLDFDVFADPPEHDEPYPGLWRLGMDRALTLAAAQAGAQRVLTGIGADEVLDTHPFHLAEDLRRWRLATAWREARRWAAADDTDPWTVLRPFGIDPVLARRRRRVPDVPPWIRPEFARDTALAERLAEQAVSGAASHPVPAVGFALAGIRSRVGDPVRWAVADPAGLVVSHPFLDRRVLREGLRVLANTRPEPTAGKPLLRAAMRSALPEPITTRRRKGHFNEVYYRGLLRNRDLLLELVGDPAVADLGILDAGALAATLRRGAVGALGVQELHPLNLALTLARWLLQEARRPYGGPAPPGGPGGLPHPGEGAHPIPAGPARPQDRLVTSTPARSPDAPGAAGGERTPPHEPPPRPVDLGSGGPRQTERERWLRRLRLQRRLHDGASLQISALVPQLGVVRKRLGDDEDGVRLSIDDLQDQLHTVLQELREVAREIYPPLLDQAGLGPALGEFADRVAVPLRVVAPQERFCPEVEGVVYFAVTHCLAQLEAGGPPAEVVLRRDGDALVVLMDGVPVRYADEVLDQVRALGGQVGVTATSTSETIRVRIPCE
ncbi:asparagine synthase-related protein [Geodermatophilus sp. SYSU D00703]